MSGFEVAGIVLGAFPVAITAIDSYRRVARKIEAWKGMRITYTRCCEDLKNEQLEFKRHLRMLVLPLVVDGDSAKALLADPSGERWKDADVSDLLRGKLGDCHELYLSYVCRMEETLSELSLEMNLDSDLIRERMELQPAPGSSRFKGALNKDTAIFQAYKAKFIQGETNRKRLFADLKDCNDKLWKLLDSSEKDAQLTRQLDAALATSTMDASLCKFWKTATAFFRALAATCRCQCLSNHAARLLLQHRPSCKSKASFQVVITRQLEQSQHRHASNWEACHMRIEEGNGQLLKESLVLAEKRIISQSAYCKPTQATSAKMTIRSKEAPNAPQAKVRFMEATPAITLEVPATDLSTSQIRPIKNLCESLGGPETNYRGYLHLPDEDTRYHVYSVAHHVKMPSSVSLARILSGEVKPSFTRRGSYTVALIIASSFLQLLDSPWLPSTSSSRAFDKLSIVFLADPSNPNIFLLQEPQISRDFRALTLTDEGRITKPDGTPQRLAGVGAPLARLGITLLELCFRSTLERQPWRTGWAAGSTDREREGFDVLAAVDWLGEVADEAGPDYAAAVSWCLVGNKTVPADRWREEMLREVIRPLQRCLDCFKLAEST